MQYKLLEYKEGIRARIYDLDVGDEFSFTEFGFRYDVIKITDTRVHYTRFRSSKCGHTEDSRGKNSSQIIIIYKKLILIDS